MGRGITIEDVARAAGVSRQTVSRVINHSPRVSPAARERVERAIAALGYVPSLAARSMGGGRSRIVLAVFEAPEGSAGLRPDTLGRLLVEGTAACAAAGHRLLFEQLAPGLPPERAAAQLAGALGALQPDGVILLPPLTPAGGLGALLAARGIAAEWLAPAGPGGGENRGEAAARHLLGLGHRQIGFVAAPEDPAGSQQCLAGYRRALARQGSRAHRHFVAPGTTDLAATLELVKSWLVPTIRPTALIVERAATARAVLHVARALRRVVPRDLSLIVLEDDALLAESQPPLAALHDGLAEGFAAACARLTAGAEAPPPAGPMLVARASLAPAPRPI